MVIMMVGLLGLLQSINLAIEHNARNHLREEVTRVGEREMNAFRANPADRTTRRISSATMPGRMFTVTKSAQSFANSLDLTVDVTWAFKNMSSRHRVKSIVANP